MKNRLNTTYKPIGNISSYLSNWLIGQLNQLTAVSCPTKALEQKLFPYLKIYLTNDSTCDTPINFLSIFH